MAIDKNLKPRMIPPVIAETDEEKRRNREAQARRKARLAEKQFEKESGR